MFKSCANGDPTCTESFQNPGMHAFNGRLTAIVQPAYLAGYIERLGTGTTDVVEICLAAGLPTPEYRQEQNHFISIIWRKSGPQEKLVQRCRSLLETIIAKPTISKEDLASQNKISVTTLKRDLRRLRRSYDITWIGWTQDGHWEVKELKK